MEHRDRPVRWGDKNCRVCVHQVFQSARPVDLTRTTWITIRDISSTWIQSMSLARKVRTLPNIERSCVHVPVCRHRRDRWPGVHSIWDRVFSGFLGLPLSKHDPRPGAEAHTAGHGLAPGEAGQHRAPGVALEQGPDRDRKTQGQVHHPLQPYLLWR